jgi:uncharacterized protein (DUF58 family)
VTKVFQVERTQEVYVIIDSSRLTARNTKKPQPAGTAPEAGTQSDLERFITSGLVLALAAEQQGDLFGLLTFNDRVGKFVRARNGREHYSTCRDALYTLHSQPVTPDYEELFAFLRVRLRRRALLVFLTNLDDPMLAESFVRNAELVSRQHLVLVNMPQPAEAQPAFAAADVNQPDDLYERLGGHLRWHRLRELQKILQHRGVTFSLLDNEHLSAELVTQYLGIKRRQLI